MNFFSFSVSFRRTKYIGFGLKLPGFWLMSSSVSAFPYLSNLLFLGKGIKYLIFLKLRLILFGFIMSNIHIIIIL